MTCHDHRPTTTDRKPLPYRVIVRVETRDGSAPTLTDAMRAELRLYDAMTPGVLAMLTDRGRARHLAGLALASNPGAAVELTTPDDPRLDPKMAALCYEVSL